MRGFSVSAALLGLDGYSICKLKVDEGFGREVDIAVAGQASGGGSGSSAGEASDEKAGASAGDATDQHAQAAAPADEGRRTLTLSFLSAGEAAGLKGITGSIERHRGEPQLKDGSPLEVSAFVRGSYDASDGSATGNNDATVIVGDWLGDFAVEVIASAAALDADVLIDAYGERCSSGNLNVSRHDDGIPGCGALGRSRPFCGSNGLVLQGCRGRLPSRDGWGIGWHRRSRSDGGGDLLSSLASKRGLDDRGDGVTVFVDRHNLLGLTSGGSLFLGLFDRLFLFRFATAGDKGCREEGRYNALKDWGGALLT